MKHKIVVNVSCGVVTDIYADSCFVDVYVVDQDNLNEDKNEACHTPFPLSTLNKFCDHFAHSWYKSYRNIPTLIEVIRRAISSQAAKSKASKQSPNIG